LRCRFGSEESMMRVLMTRCLPRCRHFANSRQFFFTARSIRAGEPYDNRLNENDLIATVAEESQSQMGSLTGRNTHHAQMSARS
jgi:hypothetical protein